VRFALDSSLLLFAFGLDRQDPACTKRNLALSTIFAMMVIADAQEAQENTSEPCHFFRGEFARHRCPAEWNPQPKCLGRNLAKC
jgi:hypothetical protein